jgi:plasmid stability protein
MQSLQSLLEALAVANMTIRNLDDDLKARLRVRAARHGWSMEEEARSILRTALAHCAEDDSGASLYAAIRAHVEPFGGIDLDLPPREP